MKAYKEIYGSVREKRRGKIIFHICSEGPSACFLLLSSSLPLILV
uniref:Uncharacterized protein n=1 Tax=Arundo donax TaxID=35708 RepID=A0A0A8Z0N2_ARUDO